MTGKEQKKINDTKALMEKMTFSDEEKRAIIDEAVCEIHAQNAKLLEDHKVNVNVFRMMYIDYTLFRQVDELVNKKINDTVAKRIEEFKFEQELKKRRGK
jgi:hypothetical protein